ncbi:Lipase [Vitis vinifera]|uniref:Lipase n=1 Tax=Vitis vinifera TaxID=29760 RepID=A0A438F6R7_VITVI|nr:Lipase [Vitis vinifera]
MEGNKEELPGPFRQRRKKLFSLILSSISQNTCLSILLRKDKDKRRSGEIETSPYGGRKNNVTPSVPQIRTRQRGLPDYGRKDLVEGGCDSLSVCSFQWARKSDVLHSIQIFFFIAELKLKHKDHSLAHYNHTLATILVEYASAVYMSDLTELFTWTCSRCDDMTESNDWPTYHCSSMLKQGFEIIELVVDIQHCLQAFVGVAQDLNAVIIAFRGTQEHSIQNWVEDLYWKQLDLNYPGMPDAMVHHGFYYAYHNTTIRPGVLNAVKRAREIYGNVPIMVTGHSMGGAMASFCGLDLIVNHEAENVQVMTFGQPRIGNAVFVSYYSELVPNTIRVTNEHDIVPHLPPYYSYFPQKTYHHFPREVWLYNIGLGSLVYTVEKECDGSGEDPTCSRSVAGNSIADHLEYYGVILHSESWNSCRIVMDPLVNEYIATDADGNFRLSKDPAVSVIKMNTRSGNGGNSV